MCPRATVVFVQRAGTWFTVLWAGDQPAKNAAGARSDTLVDSTTRRGAPLLEVSGDALR